MLFGQNSDLNEPFSVVTLNSTADPTDLGDLVDCVAVRRFVLLFCFFVLAGFVFTRIFHLGEV